MKKLVVAFCVFLFLCGVSPAETYQHKEGGISIWFPDDWEISTEGSTLSADAPDGDAFVVLDVIENAEDIEAALAAYAVVLDIYAQDFQVEGETDTVEHNGLQIYGITGKGKVEGVPWDVEVNLIDGGKAVIVCISASMLDTNEKYDAVWEKMASSLKKI